MKFITGYKEFVVEQIVESPPNRQMNISKSFQLQEMTKRIKDYEKQRSKIRSVFSDDRLSDDDIPNRLRDFLKDKNEQKFVFENEFSQLEADICNLSRQIRKKELSLKNLEADKQKKIKSSSNNLDDSKNSIEGIQKDQDEIKKSIQILQQQIIKKEANKNKIISEFEKKIEDMKKELP